MTDAGGVRRKSNRRIVLDARPIGVPEPRHFRRDDRPIEEPAVGQFRVRNCLLSIDPAQRGWVNAAANYSEVVQLGDVMRSLALGIVDASRDPTYRVGEYLYGWFGWQDFCIADARNVLRRVDPGEAPLTAAAGVLGIAGLAAYIALTEIGAPKPGETVVVSTAAGAVGSVAGQVARNLGCRVVGITGSSEKVAECQADYGYHAALSYRHGFHTEALGAVCPSGIDVFFDNTSGPIADVVWPLMNARGRIVQCGTVAEPIWEPVPSGPRRDRLILTKRLRHEGFVIFDYVREFPRVASKLAGWIREGALRHREDVEKGLDRAPHALAALYRGDNHGKKLVEP